MNTIDNTILTTKIITLQNEMDKHKEDKRQTIIKKYDDKKKNFKRNTILNTIIFALFTAAGINGSSAKEAGKVSGRNTFDKFLICAGILGMLLPVFLYNYDKSKMEQSKQKELNEVV